MSPELKALWLAALRSGEYRQTGGTLKDEGGYCCLGVLCHVASEAKLLPSNIEVYEGRGGMTVITDDDGERRESESDLPAGAFGLSESVIAECITRNDGVAYWFGNQQDFAAIADFLEQNLA